MGRRRAKLGRVSDMDIRLLRVFQAVAESRGLAAAELQLGISRSTISTHLADLETRLGARLCERGHGGFALTEAGNKVYRATMALMKSLGDFQDELETLHNVVKGRLKVAFLDNFIWNEDLKLPQRLRAFIEIGANVSLDFYILPQDEIERRLLEGSLDIALSAIFAPLPGLLPAIDYGTEPPLLRDRARSIFRR
jgi:LysR family transcriptional regulator, transcriptional activator for bauABCD operon